MEEFLKGINMSVKLKACNACQRNGRLTCRRYCDKVWTVDVFLLPVGLKHMTWLLFQDQAGGAVSEDIPSGVCGSAEEGKGCLSSRTNPQGGLQTESAGGCGEDAGGT